MHLLHAPAVTSSRPLKAASLRTPAINLTHRRGDGGSVFILVKVRSSSFVVGVGCQQRACISSGCHALRRAGSSCLTIVSAYGALYTLTAVVDVTNLNLCSHALKGPPHSPYPLGLVLFSRRCPLPPPVKSSSPPPAPASRLPPARHLLATSKAARWRSNGVPGSLLV